MFEKKTDLIMQKSLKFYKKELRDLAEWVDGKPIIPIALDFDSTVIVTKGFPQINGDNEHCVNVLKRWQNKYNVGWILDTVRDGKDLDDAVNWFIGHGIKLYGVLKNPTQTKWTSSPKCYGIFSIDDRNVNTPIIYSDEYRPRVDWMKIDRKFSPLIRELAKTRKDEVI